MKKSGVKFVVEVCGKKTEVDVDRYFNEYLLEDVATIQSLAAAVDVVEDIRGIVNREFDRTVSDALYEVAKSALDRAHQKRVAERKKETKIV